MNTGYNNKRAILLSPQINIHDYRPIHNHIHVNVIVNLNVRFTSNGEGATEGPR